MNDEEQLEELSKRLDSLLQGFCAEFSVGPISLAYLLTLQAQIILAETLDEEGDVLDDDGDGEGWKNGTG